MKRRQFDSRNIQQIITTFIELILSSISEMLHGETDMIKVINYIRQVPDLLYIYISPRNDTHDIVIIILSLFDFIRR
jgi:hypothetical protein